MANPLRQLVDLVREINQAQGAARGGKLGLERRRVHHDHFGEVPVEWEPGVQVCELADGGWTIRVELPGVERGDVDVSTLRKTVLTISGVSKDGAFRQNVLLPVNSDESKIRARYGRNVLEVYASGGTVEYPGRVEVESV